jgi:hypothetical protein
MMRAPPDRPALCRTIGRAMRDVKKSCLAGWLPSSVASYIRSVTSLYFAQQTFHSAVSSLTCSLFGFAHIDDTKLIPRADVETYRFP